MVNGTTSKLIYIGAWLCVILSMVCMTVLSITDHAIPPQIEYVSIASFGVLAGAHVKAPTGDPVKELTGGKSDAGK